MLPHAAVAQGAMNSVRPQITYVMPTHARTAAKSSTARPHLAEFAWLVNATAQDTQAGGVLLSVSQRLMHPSERTADIVSRLASGRSPESLPEHF